MKKKSVFSTWSNTDRLKKSYENWQKTDNFKDCLDLFSKLAKE